MALSLSGHRTGYTTLTAAQLATAAAAFSGLTITTGHINNLESATDTTKYAQAIVEAVAAYMAQQVSVKCGYARAVTVDDIALLRGKIQ